MVDFFLNEEWYIRTLDIILDRWGWYFGFGDMVYLPIMYLLQTQYLLAHPVDLSYPMVAFVILLQAAGYGIFRMANHQKDQARLTQGKLTIWGKKATVIPVKYQVYGGKERNSLLLCSGFWGLARHFNYNGDILLAASWCFACGFDHLLPHYYVIYLTILLIHRIERDHQRCLDKYGHYWEEYCKLVKYKLIPKVY